MIIGKQCSSLIVRDARVCMRVLVMRKEMDSVSVEDVCISLRQTDRERDRRMNHSLGGSGR